MFKKSMLALWALATLAFCTFVALSLTTAAPRGQWWLAYGCAGHSYNEEFSAPTLSALPEQCKEYRLEDSTNG